MSLTPQVDQDVLGGIVDMPTCLESDLTRSAPYTTIPQDVVMDQGLVRARLPDDGFHVGVLVRPELHRSDNLRSLDIGYEVVRATEAEGLNDPDSRRVVWPFIRDLSADLTRRQRLERDRREASAVTEPTVRVARSLARVVRLNEPLASQ